MVSYKNPCKVSLPFVLRVPRSGARRLFALPRVTSHSPLSQYK
jgi:hypothetical protein